MQYDALSSGSLALAAYETSKDQCIYSAKLGKALADIDAFLDRQAGQRWQDAKRAGPDGLVVARNMARIQGASDCKMYGLSIGYAGILYYNAGDFDQDALAEFNRLLKGEGKSQTGEAEARPPSPPAPGSAAHAIAALGDMNKVANADERRSTLQRLPGDDPPRAASRSQPPPRQSAETPLRSTPGQPVKKPSSVLQPAPYIPAPSETLPPPTALPPSGSGGLSAVSGEWRRYSNARFGVTVEYPADLVLDGPAMDLPDGRPGGATRLPAGISLSSLDGIEIRIYGTEARPGTPFARMCGSGCEGQTYSVKRSNFAVASGRRGDFVYYRRCVSAHPDLRLHCFELEYPNNRQDAMPSVIERMTRTLR